MDVNWWAFVAVVLAAYLVPGPDFIVILRSATRGARPGVAAAVGAQVGLCVHVLLAVVGLSVVLARHPDLLTAIRVVGGLYLMYLGGRLVVPTLRQGAGPRERPGHHLVDRSSRPGGPGLRSAFGQALVTNLLNPKAVLFFAAVLPQFVDAAGTPIWIQVSLLGAVDVLLGVLSWSLVVLLGVRLEGALERAAVRRWWDRATGVLLGSIGGLLVARD